MVNIFRPVKALSQTGRPKSLKMVKMVSTCISLTASCTKQNTIAFHTEVQSAM